MVDDVHFSSIHCDYGTPHGFYDKLDREFHFTLDVCASEWNAKCKDYFTVDDDALSKPWAGRCWMNPPYGRVIPKWIKKAYEESITNADLVVCLVPSRTDTKWWWDYCIKGEIRFIKGRLKFSPRDDFDYWIGGGFTSAPFPSAIIIFEKGRINKTIW